MCELRGKTAVFLVVFVICGTSGNFARNLQLLFSEFSVYRLRSLWKAFQLPPRSLDRRLLRATNGTKSRLLAATSAGLPYGQAVHRLPLLVVSIRFKCLLMLACWGL